MISRVKVETMKEIESILNLTLNDMKAEINKINEFRKNNSAVKLTNSN